MTGEAPRETHTFTLPNTFRMDKGKPLPIDAELYQPTEIQIASLGRLMTALEHGYAGHESVFMFAEMVASLFVSQDDWNAFERTLIRGELSNDAYGDFVQGVIQYFYPPEEEQAPRTGPASTRRKTTARRR